MIEVYAFLAVFTVQVLAMSVLYPARFGKYVRGQAPCWPMERLAQLFPGVDMPQAVERFLSRYRAANTVIALMGLLLLGWLINYMRAPDWDVSVVIILISVYFAVQLVPQTLVAWLGFKFNKMHKLSLLDGKRKATLERRELFDFVSPVVVVLAILTYLLLVALVIYLQPQLMPGFALVGVLTFVYASQAFIVYRALYGKQSNLLATHSDRLHAIGLKVRGSVYGCFICALFFVSLFAIDVLDMQRWVPLLQSVCLLINTYLCLMSLSAPPRKPGENGLVSATH